ncbi:MAG: ATP-binding protein, partial [Coriobacteriaceae bacterium]|nr:ATP-binding protein [Coriobacteriaceae bacterium]
FTDGAEQSDDITMLALEVGVPPEITAVLTVAADVSELPNVYGFIHGELDKRLCPKRVQNQIDIAVEELFVNVAHYAYPDATPENPGTVRVGYSYSAEPPSMSVSIVDEGIPYNPLAKPDAVTPDDIADVPIGGLGILMAKRCVDEMTYERVDGSNIVTIEKKW